MAKTLTFLLAVFLAGVAGPATAQSLHIHRSCSYGSCTKSYTWGGQGLGKVLTAPRDSSQEAADRLAAWEEFCQPRITQDPHGVRRYVYAKAGCEFGRTE